MQLKKTPLNAAHYRLGAKMVEFGGWDMPVQYTGIIEEHNAVRNTVGIFDVSHMGEVYVTGLNAKTFINNLITNDINKLVPGQILYSPMCYEHGGIVDDLLVYKFSDEKFLIVVNASNIDKDFAWMQKNSQGAELVDHSSDVGEVALQGPKAHLVLQKLTKFDLNSLKTFYFAEFEVAGVKCLVSRTGYTGEDGFEIYIQAIETENIWNAILEAGQEFGIKPCGLGCRDSLRLEAGLMLYGNDMTENVTPLEAPLKWTVKLDNHEFIGKKALLEKPLTRKLVGFELLERAVSRHGNEVYINGQKFDLVASGIFSPTLQKPIGFAFVPMDLPMGGEIEIKIREGKIVKAKICSHRFYKRK
ncbi:MAG: glycine cleavage system aminomethyltransferase GcvT [Candidatus Micrarchaeota archaeon]|nr:glycine cleavage system aminomethyltransferase GcvT [Candidatus Micrarchaeota archaeon]